MGSPKTFYIIDGYAAIFRAYFAIRNPLYSKVTGEPTQAILVFAQMLLKLYGTLEPDYVVVALDAPGKTFRDDLYAGYHAPAEEVGDGTLITPPEAVEVPEDGEPVVTPPLPTYKGTRSATPDELMQQVPRILQILDLFGIPVISKAGLEADDVIATLAERVVQDPAYADVRVRIASPDKDLEQLLGDRISLFDIHTGVETDVAALWAKRGVTPAQVVDLLSLSGDTVDNIPGVPGIGPKTAAKLLQQFDSLDRVLENLDQIKGACRANLEAARGTLPLSRRLVTLERDPELAASFDLEDARVRPVPTVAMCQFCDELGFSRLKDRLPSVNTEAGE